MKVRTQTGRHRFAIFQRLDARDQKDGTGIGLSLVKKLVLNQGGAIRVDSDGLRGTTIHFSWPNQAEEKVL